MQRRAFLRSSLRTGVGLSLAASPRLCHVARALIPTPQTAKLAEAARRQIGVTLSYDPAYTRLAYPGGDVPRSTGVCADVVIRAARDAFGLDLQRLVHEDLAGNFSAYPHAWGLAHPDASIDHRRVLNLETFWTRQQARLWPDAKLPPASLSSPATGATPGDAFPHPLAVGDLVTWRLFGRLPHVAIVGVAGPQPTVIHNVGRGVEEIPLTAFHPHRAAGQFRWPR